MRSAKVCLVAGHSNEKVKQRPVRDVAPIPARVVAVGGNVYDRSFSRTLRSFLTFFASKYDAWQNNRIGEKTA